MSIEFVNKNTPNTKIKFPEQIGCLISEQGPEVLIYFGTMTLLHGLKHSAKVSLAHANNRVPVIEKNIPESSKKSESGNKLKN